MPRIEWDDSFSLGNLEIDDQHEEWIVIHNELHESIINADWRILSTISKDILKKMTDYTRYHFKFEEEYMRVVNYPYIVEHRRAHKDFDTRIHEYYRSVRDGNVVLCTKLVKVIRNWFTDHILIEDKKMLIWSLDQKDIIKKVSE